MQSRWFSLKEEAIKMRKKGFSYRTIESSLSIPRSTLSGWLRSIPLNKKQKLNLIKKWKQGLISSRFAAIAWHNEQKAARLKEAEIGAQDILDKVSIKDPTTLDLALAMLYFGEGFKNRITGMGNSDPMILKFFIAIISKNHNVPITKFRCELHLRADQDPLKMKRYWSKELGIPISNFLGVSIDKRTVGSQTYSHYKGVCIVRCGTIAIQRKLLYIGRIFCQRVIDEPRA